MNSSVNALKFSHAASAPRVSTPSPSGRMVRWGANLWQALESVGRARARREMLILAHRWEGARPELAAQLRDACREPASV